MEEMAKIDSLTNLYNRRTFQDKLEISYTQYSLENKSFSVILFDIDDFKKVNDTYGHIFGDGAIKMVSKITKKYATKVNGFAGRYGGEEFVIFVPNKTAEQTFGVMALLHEEIKNTPLKLNDSCINKEINDVTNNEIRIDVSIGVTTYPQFGKNAEDMVNRADNAMYYAKRHGKGRIQLDEEDLNNRAD
jgi:diguanylate cyclase (GGDEF)-like protein